MKLKVSCSIVMLCVLRLRTHGQVGMARCWHSFCDRAGLTCHSAECLCTGRLTSVLQLCNSASICTSTEEVYMYLCCTTVHVLYSFTDLLCWCVLCQIQVISQIKSWVNIPSCTCSCKCICSFLVLTSSNCSDWAVNEVSNTAWTLTHIDQTSLTIGSSMKRAQHDLLDIKFVVMCYSSFKYL